MVLWSADSLTYILISSFNGHLWGLLIQTRRGWGISYFSPLSGRPHDISMFGLIRRKSYYIFIYSTLGLFFFNILIFYILILALQEFIYELPPHPSIKIRRSHNLTVYMVFSNIYIYIYIYILFLSYLSHNKSFFFPGWDPNWWS